MRYLDARLFHTLILSSFLLVAAACEDFGDEEETAAEPSPTPETAEAVDVAGPDDDPRDLLFELFDATEAEDYQTIYENLVSDFQLIPFEPDMDERRFWLNLVAPVNHVEHWDGREHPADNPDSWQIEQHEGFVVVRHREHRDEAFVFRAENGQWRLDPGEFSLVRAWEYALPETERGQNQFMAMPEHYEMEHHIEGVDQFPLPGMFMYPLYTFTMHNGYADATVSWELRSLPGEPIGDFEEYLYHDVLIPLDGLTWTLGDQSGPVSVVWTNAILEEDRIVLPAPPEDLVDSYLEEGQLFQSGMTEATLRLLDLPEDVDETDEVTLHTDSIQIGPMGEGAPAGEDEPLLVDYTFQIPMTSSTAVLAGDLPETAEDPAQHDVAPVPPADVPPGPDPADLMAIEAIDYERDEGYVSALVQLDTGGINPEWGRSVDIEWSDGEMTVFAPETLAGAEVMELEIDRDGAPDRVEIDALHFEHITFDLETDPGGMIHDDRIETKWGDFPIGNIVESTDGSGTVYYAAAGRRIIHQSTLEHGGETINFATTAYGRGEDFIPERTQLGFSQGFVDALEDLPLPTEVSVREIAPDVVVTME